jgi:hypothetical protein
VVSDGAGAGVAGSQQKHQRLTGPTGPWSTNAHSG